MTDDPRATLEHPDPHGDDSRTPGGTAVSVVVNGGGASVAERLNCHWLSRTKPVAISKESAGWSTGWEG